MFRTVASVAAYNQEVAGLENGSILMSSINFFPYRFFQGVSISESAKPVGDENIACNKNEDADGCEKKEDHPTSLPAGSAEKETETGKHNGRSAG